MRMAKIKAAKRVEASAAPETSSVRPTRFDPAHKIPRAEEAAPAEALSSESSSPDAITPYDIALEAEDMAAELAEALTHAEQEAADPQHTEDDWRFSAALVQQFRTQAQQLASHLENRQRELDRREAEFHAQIARHESEARSARLWFQEHHHDLRQRQASLEEQKTQAELELAELEQRVAEQQAIAQGAFVLPRELADKLSTRQGELSNQDLELLRKAAKDHEAATQLALRQRQCETMERVLQDRTERMDEAALSLARGEADLEDGWQKLQAQRNAWNVQVDRQRQKLADDRRRLEADLAAQQDKLRQRGNHLEMRSAALDQTRAELLQLQRDTLEMRLATEEMWAQLSTTAPPAAITHSLARTRAKLAEHFRMQSGDVAAQRQEVETLAAKVAAQHEQMASQKREFESWTIQQQRELESQAARIMAREAELEKEHSRMQQVQLQWDIDRRELQREIRDLQSELRNAESGQLAMS
jgi:hypothetical protein